MKTTDDSRKIEFAIKRKERRDFRRNVMGVRFSNFFSIYRPWFLELAQRYKARGEFPITPLTLLHSYYTDPQDKVIAVFFSVLAPDNKNVLENTSELRETLGNNPYEWFLERGFVRLSVGSEKYKRTGGVKNWELAATLDSLWQECEANGKSTIEEAIKRIRNENFCSYYEALSLVLKEVYIPDVNYRLRLLLLVLGTSGGIGIGAWSIPPSDIEIPPSLGVVRFVRTWFPQLGKYGDFDKAISLYDMGEDLFYAYLAFTELQRINPRGCKSFVSTYVRWYNEGLEKYPCQHKMILPEIPF